MINEARKSIGSFTISHDGKGGIELVELYETGFSEGMRYKAWEIIFQTPDMFAEYFSDGKENKSNTIPATSSLVPNLFTLDSDKCLRLYQKLIKEGGEGDNGYFYREKQIGSILTMCSVEVCVLAILDHYVGTGVRWR